MWFVPLVKYILCTQKGNDIKSLGRESLRFVSWYWVVRQATKPASDFLILKQPSKSSKSRLIKWTVYLNFAVWWWAFGTKAGTLTAQTLARQHRKNTTPVERPKCGMWMRKATYVGFKLTTWKFCWFKYKREDTSPPPPPASKPFY